MRRLVPALAAAAPAPALAFADAVHSYATLAGVWNKYEVGVVISTNLAPSSSPNRWTCGRTPPLT